MPQYTFTCYSKKELIELIEKTMEDDNVAILSTGVVEFETKPKKKASFLKFQFPHEMLSDPEDLRWLVNGNVLTSIVIARKPENVISKEYLAGVKEVGFHGFTLE